MQNAITLFYYSKHRVYFLNDMYRFSALHEYKSYAECYDPLLFLFRVNICFSPWRANPLNFYVSKGEKRIENVWTACVLIRKGINLRGCHCAPAKHVKNWSNPKKSKQKRTKKIKAEKIQWRGTVWRVKSNTKQYKFCVSLLLDCEYEIRLIQIFDASMCENMY